MGYGHSPVFTITIDGVYFEDFIEENSTFIDATKENFIQMDIIKSNPEMDYYVDMYDMIFNDYDCDYNDLPSYGAPNSFIKIMIIVSRMYPRKVFSIDMGDGGFYTAEFDISDGQLKNFEEYIEEENDDDDFWMTTKDEIELFFKEVYESL